MVQEKSGRNSFFVIFFQDQRKVKNSKCNSVKVSKTSLESSNLRVTYAANISEHLPTQPWEYTHKDQTTTPGTTSPTCEQWVGS